MEGREKRKRTKKRQIETLGEEKFAEEHERKKKINREKAREKTRDKRLPELDLGCVMYEDRLIGRDRTEWAEVEKKRALMKEAKTGEQKRAILEDRKAILLTRMSFLESAEQLEAMLLKAGREKQKESKL